MIQSLSLRLFLKTDSKNLTYLEQCFSFAREFISDVFLPAHVGFFLYYFHIVEVDEESQKHTWNIKDNNDLIEGGIRDDCYLAYPYLFGPQFSL